MSDHADTKFGPWPGTPAPPPTLQAALDEVEAAREYLGQLEATIDEAARRERENATLRAEIERLQTAIKGHCALLRGHQHHTDNIVDCLGEVHQAFQEKDAEIQRLREALEEAQEHIHELDVDLRSAEQEIWSLENELRD